MVDLGKKPGGLLGFGRFLLGSVTAAGDGGMMAAKCSEPADQAKYKMKILKLRNLYGYTAHGYTAAITGTDLKCYGMVSIDLICRQNPLCNTRLQVHAESYCRDPK